MSTISDRVEELRKIFIFKDSGEERTLSIIEMGRSLPPYPNHLKIPALEVPGCQSILYLSSHFSDGKLFFQAHSDALVSRGLAALLIFVYSGQPPEEILKTPPLFLKDFGVLESLSLSRSNGLAQIHLRMKKDAAMNLERLLNSSH